MTISTGLSSVSAMTVDESSVPASLPQLVGSATDRADLALTTNEKPNPNVQIEVEVHTTEGASALARALGPNDTEVKTNTVGEGHGRAVARLDGELSTAASAPTVAATASPTSEAYVSSTTPMAVIGAELVNLRSAPSLSAAVVGQARVGERLRIVGRDSTNSWWLVCCAVDRLVWISAHVVTTDGDLTDISVLPLSTLALTGRSGETMAKSAGDSGTVDNGAATQRLATSGPYPFQLVQQQQHGERITPRIFLYVNDHSAADIQEGLPGFGLLVKKDGVILSAPERTHGGQPDFTWPIPHERQKLANFKVEFPTVNPVGHWEIQLIDQLGQPVGPITSFDFGPNEPNLEMYLHYQK
ncbi:MAG TPA: SH3 domain-containing protein [Caldilineaceae bacterium]|nr:SH3 domain-containing protein [Caldilineaceae bacterium]